MVDVHLLVLASVQDLQHSVTQRVSLVAILLDHLLDQSELAEVELPLLVQNLVIGLQFLNLLVHEFHVLRGARSRTNLLHGVVDAVFERSLGLGRLRFVLLHVHGLGNVFGRHTCSLLGEIADSSSTSCHRIVFLAAVVNFEVLFDPLAHFGVIE